MVPSHDGKYVALFTHDSYLWVVSVDFQHAILDTKIDSKTKETPIELKWVGTDIFLLHYQDVVLVVGRNGEVQRLPSQSHIKIAAEVDGARLISNTKHEFISSVPECLIEIFGDRDEDKDSSPARMLFNAWKLFQKRDSDSDRLIRKIGPQYIRRAIMTCLDAATRANDITIQKELLNVINHLHRPPILEKSLCQIKS